MTSAPARRQTRRLRADPDGIAQAAAILRAGGLVAFPTETVYGLGGHALDSAAVRGIFEAKQRPADDPLIVHLHAVRQVEHVAELDEAAHKLARHFWPGPLTLVLPRHAVVPSEVTAGLETVAVRVPAHAVAHALLRAVDLPIAAPSANLFGRPSPTRAEHVLADLDGRIDAVLDGGSTTVGVESTIVDLTSHPPRLLRPGGLASEAIESVLGVSLVTVSGASAGPQPAPGLLASHYAPRTPLLLVVGPPELARERLFAEVRAHEGRVGVLALDEDRAALDDTPHVVVGTWTTPQGSAARLYAALRELDAAGLELIVARELADPSAGLGRALADRLRRAARRVVDARS